MKPLTVNSLYSFNYPTAWMIAGSQYRSVPGVRKNRENKHLRDSKEFRNRGKSFINHKTLIQCQRCLKRS